LGSYRVCRQAC